MAAWRFKDKNDLTAAAVSLEEAVNILRRQGLTKELAKYCNLLADTYFLLGNYDDAEAIARESIAIEKNRNENGVMRTRLGTYYMMLVKILVERGKLGDALVCAENALHIFRAVYGNEDDYVTNIKKIRDRIQTGMAN